MTAPATTFSLACPPKDGKMQQGSQGRQAEGGRILPAPVPFSCFTYSPGPTLYKDEVFPI